MARYYKNRYNRRRDNTFDGFAGLILILLLVYGYTGAMHIIADFRFGLLIVISVLTLIVMLVLGFIAYRWKLRKSLYDALTISAVDNMDGLEFERYLADLLRKLEYTDIQLTEKYDFGVDIIAKKDGLTWGIQAKRYSHPVKVDAVRQVYTGLHRYNCDRAMVITNSTYSYQARELARDNSIVLVDRTILAKWIYEMSRITK